MRPALLGRAAASKDARASFPIRKPFLDFLTGEPLSCPAARRGTTSFSPVACGVAGRCVARSTLRLPRPSTLHAARALLRTCGLRRCGPHSCAAQRRPRTLVPHAQFANHFTLFSAGEPLRARRRQRRGALPHARRSKPSARRATLRVGSASLWSCSLRRCGPHSCAAPRRPSMPTPQAASPISVGENAALPGRPLWRHALLARRQRRCGALRGAASRATIYACHAPCHIARCAHLAPALLLATMRRALLRRAATFKDARAARPIRRYSLQAKPFVALPPAVAPCLSSLSPAALRCAAARATL